MQTPKFDSFNDKFKKYFNRKKPSIDEVVREPTAGGIVFRRNKKTKEIEILLIQDAKDRWTIPKGHIEEGETAQETALREIAEDPFPIPSPKHACTHDNPDLSGQGTRQHRQDPERRLDERYQVVCIPRCS